VGWDVTWSVWPIIIVGFQFGTLLAVGRRAVKVLVAHVGRPGAGLPKIRGRVLEGVMDVDVGGVSAECRIRTRVLLGKIEWRKASVWGPVRAGGDVVDAVLLLVDTPGGICAFDKIGNGGELVGTPLMEATCPRAGVKRTARDRVALEETNIVDVKLF
jgi:hypothetical protein